nr:WEB family protein At5g55860 [Tanacetum cinerariifolium]
MGEVLNRKSKKEKKKKSVVLSQRETKKNTYKEDTRLYVDYLIIETLKNMYNVSVTIMEIEISRHKGETNAPSSDSWAWRNYGRKPIKGSPYPRSKIMISREAFESLSQKVEDSERLAGMKVEVAMAQIEAIGASEKKALKWSEATQKEINEL